MKSTWRGRVAFVTLLAGLLTTSSGLGVTPASAAPPIKESAQAGITQNWDENLPSASRFVVLSAFNNEAPVNVLELDGQRYLVAPRGDTQWVRTLRATGRGELRRRGRVEPFRAIEIPDSEKPRVIEAYLARWGYQVKGYFKALPDPADGLSGRQTLIRNVPRSGRSKRSLRDSGMATEWLQLGVAC